jgi:hypothetical protein
MDDLTLAALKMVREYSITAHKLEVLWQTLNKPDVRPLLGACDEATFTKFCRYFVKPDQPVFVDAELVVPPPVLHTCAEPPAQELVEVVPSDDFELADPHYQWNPDLYPVPPKEVVMPPPVTPTVKTMASPKKKARVESSEESSEEETPKRKLRSRSPKKVPDVVPASDPELRFGEDDFWCQYGCGYRDKALFDRKGANEGRCLGCQNKTIKSKIKPEFVVEFDRTEHPKIRGRVTWAEQFFTCHDCGCFRHKDSFSSKGIGKGVCLVHAAASDFGRRVQKKWRNCDHCHMNHPLDAFTGLALKRGGRIKCREAGGIWAEEDEDEEDIDDDEEEDEEEEDPDDNSFIAPEDEE